MKNNKNKIASLKKHPTIKKTTKFKEMDKRLNDSTRDPSDEAVLRIHYGDGHRNLHVIKLRRTEYSDTNEYMPIS